jgi:hypothetical protein
VALSGIRSLPTGAVTRLPLSWARNGLSIQMGAGARMLTSESVDRQSRRRNSIPNLKSLCFLKYCQAQSTNIMIFIPNTGGRLGFPLQSAVDST